MNRAIHIHQALHGYQDGHQLLASSVVLPRELQALTLTMSDLSGPGFRAGFETYLTGYPLDGVGHYCLARTWFAPEQSRPGCVWTHTLIIRFDDLARLGRIQLLERLFHRPSLSDTFEEYKSPLELSGFDLGAHEPLPALLENNASTRVLEALYGTGQKVILSCANASTYEALVLAVIDQQWPRLKRGFWFCTGSLSLRETQFDLSVSPPELSHLADDSVLFIESGSEESIPRAEWVRVAVTDLIFPKRSTLRAFLFKYGSDFPNGRAAFRPLTELFILLSSPRRSTVGDKVLSAIAYFFPEKPAGHRIKQDVFSLDGEFVSAVGGDAGVVRLALTHPGANTIGEDVLDIELRAENIARRQPVAALDLATMALAVDGKNSEKYLSGYFNAMEDTGSFAGAAPPSMVLYALSHKPELLAHEQVWERLEREGLASAAILQLTDDVVSLHSTIKAMIAARAWGGLNLALRRFGVVAYQCLFDHLQANGASQEVVDYPDELFTLLWSRPELVVTMISRGGVPSIPLNMIAAEADPRSYQLRSLGLAPWMVATQERKTFSSPFREDAALVFYLATSLYRLGDDAPALISRSFPRIYARIEDGLLDSVLLRRLETSLTWSATKPGVAARLVRTIVRAYADERWPVIWFACTFKHPVIFSAALRELKDIWRGTGYIRLLKASRRAKNCPLSQNQIDALDRL